MSDTILRILERYTMEVDGPTPERDSWFLDWLLRSPKHVGGHLTRSYHAFKSLREVYEPEEIQTAMEYFAGVGAHALVIEDLFAPDVHVVQDYSEDSASHLRRVLPPNVEVRQADSYAPESFMTADLVAFDCGDMTVWQTREGLPLRGVLDRIFGAEPKAVVLTDIAAPYLHLHRERYETLLGPGTCASYPTYVEALCARFEALYGYRLHRGYWDRWSTVMAFVPDTMIASNTIMPTPDSPVGLEIF